MSFDNNSQSIRTFQSLIKPIEAELQSARHDDETIKQSAYNWQQLRYQLDAETPLGPLALHEFSLLSTYLAQKTDSKTTEDQLNRRLDVIPLPLGLLRKLDNAIKNQSAGTPEEQAVRLIVRIIHSIAPKLNDPNQLPFFTVMLSAEDCHKLHEQLKRDGDRGLRSNPEIANLYKFLSDEANIPTYKVANQREEGRVASNIGLWRKVQMAFKTLYPDTPVETLSKGPQIVKSNELGPKAPTSHKRLPHYLRVVPK